MLRLVSSVGRPKPMAAGVTWQYVDNSGNTSWDARGRHTSVIDAAGAIYVIGGYSGYARGSETNYNDVWKSTDGGADQT